MLSLARLLASTSLALTVWSLWCGALVARADDHSFDYFKFQAFPILGSTKLRKSIVKNYRDYPMYYNAIGRQPEAVNEAMRSVNKANEKHGAGWGFRPNGESRSAYHTIGHQAHFVPGSTAEAYALMNLTDLMEHQTDMIKKAQKTMEENEAKKRRRRRRLRSDGTASALPGRTGAFLQKGLSSPLWRQIEQSLQAAAGLPPTKKKQATTPQTPAGVTTAWPNLSEFTLPSKIPSDPSAPWLHWQEAPGSSLSTADRPGPILVPKSALAVGRSLPGTLGALPGRLEGGLSDLKLPSALPPPYSPLGSPGGAAGKGPADLLAAILSRPAPTLEASAGVGEATANTMAAWSSALGGSSSSSSSPAAAAADAAGLPQGYGQALAWLERMNDFVVQAPEMYRNARKVGLELQTLYDLSTPESIEMIQTIGQMLERFSR